MQKKICMLGAFAVGKTSLVSRFVHSIFSEEYQTTIGVKIDKKELVVDGRRVKLMVWDLGGEDELEAVRMSYLRGASGYFLVVDTTRAETLETALDLRRRVEQELGPLPFVLVANKTDLESERALEASRLEESVPGACDVVESSAKTGEGVEQAFERLTRRMLESDG